MTRTVLHVVGARPNFMKVAPVIHAIASRSAIRQLLAHTGQHYDAAMSDVFFDDLSIPRPDFNLEVGSGTHAFQTAHIMMRLEEVIVRDRPDLVLVYGDVNSTVAAALVCAKLLVPLAHVEAGLRSFDRTMPEEVNRIVTDRLADLLFTPSDDGDDNLLREGVDRTKIHCVGNVMIDTLVRLLPKAAERWPKLAEEWRLDRFGLITLHRPSNVDDETQLQRLSDALGAISRELPFLFPLHPRTQAALQRAGYSFPDTVRVVPPLGYIDFLALQQHATCVITDSGGIQEETTYLGVPCVTVRDTTERPVTVTVGTNVLAGRDSAAVPAYVDRILRGEWKRGSIPPLWDGHAAERVAAIVDQQVAP